jgi:hypothetical protein
MTTSSLGASYRRINLGAAYRERGPYGPLRAAHTSRPLAAKLRAEPDIQPDSCRAVWYILWLKATFQNRHSGVWVGQNAEGRAKAKRTGIRVA